MALHGCKHLSLCNCVLSTANIPTHIKHKRAKASLYRRHSLCTQNIPEQNKRHQICWYEMNQTFILALSKSKWFINFTGNHVQFLFASIRGLAYIRQHISEFISFNVTQEINEHQEQHHTNKYLKHSTAYTFCQCCNYNFTWMHENRFNICRNHISCQ